MARVLLTGAAGFIGSFLAERLIHDGNAVIGVDNLFRGRAENLSHLTNDENFHFVNADLAQDASVATDVLCQGIDIVYHFAAINGTRHFYDHPFEVLSVNTESTVNLIQAVEKYPVGKIVYASSSEVYGEPITHPIGESHPLVLSGTEVPRHTYAASKMLGELYTRWSAERSGHSWVNLRIFNTYGPRMDTSRYGQVVPEFIHRILSDQEFKLYGPGTQARSFCYIDDMVEMIVRAGARVEDETLNVGNDEETTILELGRLLHQIRGKVYQYTLLEPLEGDIRRRVPDITKARRLLDYTPGVSLHEGLTRAVDWYRRAGNLSGHETLTQPHD